MEQRIGIAAITAAVLAVVSFFIAPLWAILAAGGASIAGVVGMVKASSPKVRGFFISLGAMILAGGATIFALLRAIF